MGCATDYPTGIAYCSDRRRSGIPSRRQVSFTAPIVRVDTRPRGSGRDIYLGVQKTRAPKDGGAPTYISIVEPLGSLIRGHRGAFYLAAESGDKVVGGDKERKYVYSVFFFAVLFCKLSRLSVFSESKSKNDRYPAKAYERCITEVSFSRAPRLFRKLGPRIM